MFKSMQKRQQKLAFYLSARVVELVDAADSKSAAARRAGSIPASGTTTIF
jgi:hypothetical protein